ncbi:hypothetical protein MHM84_05030 [Halomonas sp. McH1-25]|uniref:hypothetical protein n=1 Tax=unclassified Halomonas TaxID=2609666 RepID=UPI001EF61B2F|nr:MULTISPECIES: hypothetical protein [unclassified Halomonas]MCG7599139.1 hypothetical protein [Halomonas sp. McH1-25]MCP1343607.1 hypothetical protein [Halomonas sp. FL8]MCP1361089.1 hypothetical protein [Halomonas sp. BBD45]MCP1365274.1 hypothetical protein [Halomonas sp. BBD48]
MQLCLVAQALLALLSRQWHLAIISLLVVLITFFPVLFERQFRIRTPVPLQLLAFGFVIASLFFGEGKGFYSRFWWWDIALHTVSGGLFSVVGFLLAYGANGVARIRESAMVPGFVALFAFAFSLGVGVVWEIFEFSMDRLFDTNMQRAMLNDAAGLTDTMWDLIMNTLGALVVSLLGWRCVKYAEQGIFLKRWIDTFIERNPRLFKRPR